MCNLLAYLSTALVVVFVPLCFGAILQYGECLNEVKSSQPDSDKPCSFHKRKICITGKVIHGFIKGNSRIYSLCDSVILCEFC